VNIRIEELPLNHKFVADPQTSKANLASSGNASTGLVIANASSGIQEPRNEKPEDII